MSKKTKTIKKNRKLQKSSIEKKTNSSICSDKKKIRKTDNTLNIATKTFYKVMENETGYVDGLSLIEKMKLKGCDLKNDPNTLWKVWKQVETEFPYSIDFIPQSSVFWTSKPSGWKYIGPPRYDVKRKRKKIK